ncbi:MAG TPA: hypothetical protein VFB73_05740 [Chloroflexota bacterium]|nr:hypothetical protein [Chloroflexota bacterium]
MGEGLLALLRAAHGLAAAIWLGVSLVGALAPSALTVIRARGWSLRTVAQVALWALVVTGAVLMLDRLADPAVSTLYVALLGLKLALVGAMGMLGLLAPRGAGAGEPNGGWRWLPLLQRERVLLGLGLGAFVLGSLLTSAYESALRG